MSDKKGKSDGLRGFLKKQAKKPKKPTATGTSEPGTPAEEKIPGDADVVESPDPTQTTGKVENDSPDVSDDDLGQNAVYGTIRDKKDVTTAQEQQDKLKAGYGFDEPDGSTGASAGGDGAKDAKQKKNTVSDIKFGGAKPKPFTRGNRNRLGGEFSAGLDDIDDDGKGRQESKEQIQGGQNTTGAAGSRAFMHLGASARTGATEPEGMEQKTPATQPAVKPTFRGKLNLNRGNQDEDNAGVVKSYDFKGIALRGPATDKDTMVEGKEDGDHQPRKEQGAFNQGRKPRDKGQPFYSGAARPGDDGFDDDGFEITKEGRGKDRKGRPVKQKTDSDSDSDDGPQFTRGGSRGGRGGPRGGRGGFFKNSKRDAVVKEDTEKDL